MQGRDPNQSHPLVIEDGQGQSLDHQSVIGEGQGPCQDHQSAIGEGGGLALIHLHLVSSETVGPDHLSDLIIVQGMIVKDCYIEIEITMIGVGEEIWTDHMILVLLF